MPQLGSIVVIEVIDDGRVLGRLAVLTFFAGQVREGHTKSRPVIKDDNRLGLPAHAGLEVVARNHVVHEEIKQPALFGVLQTLDLGDEFAIEEKTLLAGHRMHSHKRVDGVDSVFTDEASCQTSVVDHLGGRVNCIKSVQECAECWGETP